MELMEVETAEGEDLVGCEEDEQLEWSPSVGTQEEEEDEEGLDEGLPYVVMETDSSPIRILPIPVEPLQSHVAAEMPLESADPAALSFRVNGHLVSPDPGGGSTELTLRCHPGGSASGFTSVTVPVAPTVHSPERPPHNHTSAAGTTPAGAPTPIITGVISGEAAHKVLSNNNVKFSAAPTGRKTPPSADPRVPSPHTSPPSFPTTREPASVRPASSPKMPHKGEPGPVRPPDCVVCRFQYKLITELRGFMCMCSPAIAQSLNDLKKKGGKNWRRSREEKKTTRRSRVSAEDSTPKATSSHWKTRRPSEDRLSELPASSARPPKVSSAVKVDPAGAPPTNPPSQGKLVILVEDFYYGSDPGRSLVVPKVSGSYNCSRCEDTLPNNVRLMSHMLQHEASKDSVPFCPHCLRHFLSVLMTQRHVERVHRRQSSVTCRICELAFGTEPDFLWHMKTTHKPGEMPYTCQVCDFRSSFFSDVWTHFQDVHAETRNLLCHYCLRVLRSPSCYQQHLTQHQSKQAFSCYKCRLHFLYNRERLEHETMHHKTHIKPPQLSGLKPGTKVTVRTYSMAGGVAPTKVVDVPAPPFNQPPQKRRKMESLGQLLWSPDPDSVPVASFRCVECRTGVPDLRAHFPSVVHCSLCRFSTCCSTSYANHMINHHVVHRKSLQHAMHQTIFTSNPRVSEILQCVSCTLSTHSGDVMANHLTEQPEHTCIMLPIGPSVCVDEIQEQREDDVPPHNVDSVASSGVEGGVFLPIGLSPALQTSSQLSVKPLTSPSPLSSPAAMTIKFLGPKRTLPLQTKHLSRFQLAVVLSSLCHGVCQAALRFRTAPMMIRSWIEQHQRSLPHRTWLSPVESQVKWVLSCRENQLSVNENILLLMAKSILRQEKQEKTTGHATADGEPTISPKREAADSLEAERQSQTWDDKQLLLDCYIWSVDFMLKEELGLQNHSQPGKLPDCLLDRCHGFIQSLRSLIQISGLPPHSVACLDEFPIFMNSKRFFSQDQLAFQLSSTQKERPLLDVVLAALSDGTLLPPLLFFNGITPVVPEGFPNNVLLEARAEGFTNLDRLEIWIDKVWQPYVSSHCTAKSLLMLDSYRGHLNTTFRDKLSSMSTVTHHFPTCCCCRLQPLEVCVVPVLKDFLQARWTQLVSEGGLEGLSLQQLALTLACWLSEVTSTLNSQAHFLLRSFSSVFDQQQLTDRSKVVKMILELTKAVSCPLEARGGAEGVNGAGGDSGAEGDNRAGGVGGAGGVNGAGGVGGAGAIVHVKQEEDQSEITMPDMTETELKRLEKLGGGDTAEEEQPLMAEVELKEVKQEKELLNEGLSTVFQVFNGDSNHKSVNGL